MNRRSNLPPFDACTSTSSYPSPATAGSITASSAAMDASLRAPQTKNGPKPIFDAVPLKLWKFNRIWHLAPLSRRQIARQLDRAVADADQTADSGADRLEQAPHFGLVIHQDAGRLLGEQAYSFTVDGDLVCRERTIAKPGGPPGDADPARFDPGLDFAPRAMTSRSQELLQPLASRLSRRFRWRLVPARNRQLAARRRSPPDARAEGFWRFPRAAAAPPACAARDRRETCGWWRKAPAGPASRAGPRRRSSRGSPASG